MSAEPLPLHCRVAVALGWTDVQSLGPRQHGPSWHTPGAELWVGVPPCPNDEGPVEPGYGERSPCDCAPLTYSYVPPYGQESPEGAAAHGPLLPRLKAFVGWNGGAWVCQAWAIEGEGRGATWGEALCNLVLALAEAGRLEEVR